MFIGPITFQNLKKLIDQYKNKNKKEHFGYINILGDVNEVQPAHASVIGLGITVFVLYLFFVAMWIWNIVLISMYWNRMPIIARILAIIGIVSGVFAPISVFVTYITIKSL